MKPPPLTFYFAHNAELLENGVLRVGTGGSDGDRLFDGYYDVPPDSPDYNFWLWLKQRQKPPWYRFGPVGGLDEQTIVKYRQEYAHESASHAAAPGRGEPA